MAIRPTTKQAIKKVVITISCIGILTGGVALFKGDKIVRHFVNKKIGSDKTYTDVLDAVSETTKMDELLTPVKYDAIDAAYRDARLKGEYEAARQDLAMLYDYTLKAAICNHEGIEIGDLQNYEVWLETDNSKTGKTDITAKCAVEYEKLVTEESAGNIITKKVVKTSTSYILEDQLYDMAYNYIMLKNDYPFANKEIKGEEAFTLSQTDDNSIRLSNLDSDYLALERFLLTEDVDSKWYNGEKLGTSYEFKKYRAL